MASSQAPNILAFLADAAISKGMAVKIGTDSKHVAKSTAATDGSIGIAQVDASSAEDGVEVAMPGGGAKALAAGVISAGDYLAPDSTGGLVATTSANDNVIAQALESAVSGDLFAVSVLNFNY